MITLNDKTILYHGSYIEISSIDLSASRKSLDFGKGFYVTSSYSQARGYVPSAVKKNIRFRKIPENFDVSQGCISMYKFNFSDDLKVFQFKTADIEWLHYIAACRNDLLFPKLKEQYSQFDIIGGKVANDNTAATLNAYINGEYGEPGTIKADEFAISQLLPERLTDQFCFKTQKAIETLEFLGSELYGK